MKYNFRISVITMLLIPFMGFGQKGDSRQVLVGMNKSNIFNQDKSNGFEFSNLPFRYQFVNCGGDVQMGINYDKKANYTAFYMDGKKYYKYDIDKLNPSYWPKPDQIELNTVGADLYFKGGFLGKVTLTYIVGNFAGCFGETFDVLAQVGKSPKEAIYKDNINDLTLKNVVVLYGGPTGGLVGKIEGALKEQKKQEELNAQVQALLSSANYQYSVSNFKEAKKLFEQAYRLQPNNQNIKKSIEQSDAAITQEAERVAAEKAKEAELEQTTLGNTTTAGSGNGGSEASNAGNGSKASSSKAGGASNTTSSQSNSETKKAETTPKPKNTIGNTGKTFEQLEYERRVAEAQQKARIQQAVNPGGYAMEQSGANAFFRNQIANIQREADLRRAKEEKEWLAKKRREEIEARKREQEYEKFKKELIQRQAEGREQRLDDYRSKGGDRNFSNKLNQWKNFATKEIQQVNKYLNLYQGQTIKSVYPQNSCDYVTAIENISQSKMPNDYKATLINNILEIRNQYYKFYIDNAFISEEWFTRFDDIGRSNTYGTCSNYLERIADATEFNRYGPFTQNDEYVINNTIYNPAHLFYYQENYKIPFGALHYPASFKQAVKEKGINMHQKQIGRDLDDVWNKFHKRPYNWSTGWYHDPSAAYGYTDGLGYKSKTRFNRQEYDKEVALYYEFYETKRKFRLNTIENELQMMYFSYHSGDVGRAYDHFLRYIGLQYGGFDQMVKVLQSDQSKSFFINDGNGDSHIGIAFSTLLMEAGEYEKALKLLPIINNNSPQPSLIAKERKAALLNTTESLRNKIYFRLGEYDKMYLPKNEKDIKDFIKDVNYKFKYVKPKSSRVYSVSPAKCLINKIDFYITNDIHLKALALIKLNRSKEAKILLTPLYNYFTKKENKQLPTFHGDAVDIEAMKEALNTLFSGKGNALKYQKSSRYLFENQENFKNYDWINYLQIIGYSLYHSQLKPLNLTPLNLDVTPEWKQIEEKLRSHNGSKASMEALYNQLSSLYENKKLEKNESHQNFLLTYIQLGMALGNFHEMLPVAVKYQMLFPENELLETQLSILMWPQKDVFITKKNYDLQQKKYIYPPIIEFFNSALTNENQKANLDFYLNVWARDKVSSPIIPFLYREAFRTFEGAREKRLEAERAAIGLQLEKVAAGFNETKSGLRYQIIQKGKGKKAEKGNKVLVHYKGQFLDGTVIDSSNQPLEFQVGVGQVIAGFDEGILLLNEGDKARLVIPSDLGYGSRGAGGVIPPNAHLIYDVELVKVK